MTLLVAGTLRISVMLVAALLACAVLRRRSASLRHWLLAASIGCAAAMPLLQLVTPAWSVPLVGSVTTAATAAAIEPARITATAAAATTAPQLSPPAAPVAIAAARWTGSTTPPMAQLLLVLWAAGVTVALAMLALGLLRLWLLARSAQCVDGPWTPVVRQLSRQFGISRTVRVLQ